MAQPTEEKKEMERLQEQIIKLRNQNKNASKMLMKVDDYLQDLQDKKKVDSHKLNSVITDLRDAINMIS